MISIIVKYKRVLILICLSIIFLIGGVALMEQDIEFSGSIFLIMAFSTFLYLPISWFIDRKRESDSTESYSSKEVWAVSVISGILCLIAAIESYQQFVVFTILFVEILLLIVVFVYVNFIGERNRETTLISHDTLTFPTWVIWVFVIGNGILLPLFEDSFNDKEQFGIAFLSYLFVLFFLVFRWILNQIKTIIDLKNEKTRTELLHLQSQVNPHFFFNMLNNLYGWIEKDSKKAQAMILDLSDMMRYSIYDGQKEQVTIQEEVDYLKKYISLHKSRYHKKIDVSFNTVIQDASYPVMPLLFIILLENAFKHGVENLRLGAYVNVNLVARKNQIRCSVENNFDPESEVVKTGIGLNNLRRRLELMYPKKHKLSLSKENDIYKAQLILELA